MEIYAKDNNNTDQLPLITVAVPIYNSEHFLVQCLESIVNQTYKNLDILLVNDGSTDGSVEICETYQKRDPRIRLFSKQNGGIGTSRNTILQLIQGDYVVFVDNDDWIDEKHVSTLYHHLAKNQSDIAVGNFVPFHNEENTFHFHGNFSDSFEKNYSPEEWFEVQYDAKCGLSQCFTVPWGKLYKSSLFDGIAYPEDKKVEDDYTTYLIYLKVQKITYIHKPLYIHRKTKSSITQSVPLSDIFPIQSIEERLTLLTILGYDIRHEIIAYKARLQLHQIDHLKRGNIAEYKRAKQKYELIQHRFPNR